MLFQKLRKVFGRTLFCGAKDFPDLLALSLKKSAELIVSALNTHCQYSTSVPKGRLSSSRKSSLATPQEGNGFMPRNNSLVVNATILGIGPNDDTSEIVR